MKKILLGGSFVISLAFLSLLTSLYFVDLFQEKLEGEDIYMSFQSVKIYQELEFGSSILRIPYKIITSEICEEPSTECTFLSSFRIISFLFFLVNVFSLTCLLINLWHFSVILILNLPFQETLLKYNYYSTLIFMLSFFCFIPGISNYETNSGSFKNLLLICFTVFFSVVHLIYDYFLFKYCSFKNYFSLEEENFVHIKQKFLELKKKYLETKREIEDESETNKNLIGLKSKAEEVREIEIVEMKPNKEEEDIIVE